MGHIPPKGKKVKEFTEQFVVNKDASLDRCRQVMPDPLVRGIVSVSLA